MFLHKNIVIYFSACMMIVFMLQISMNTLIYFRFKINQDYVAKEICMNRFDTESTCKGNCYLKSQLKKSEDKTASFQTYIKYKIDLYFVRHVCLNISAAGLFQKKYPGYVFFHVKEIDMDFFHPPA